MEEKDIKEIATAVSGALAKLNADTKAAEDKAEDKDKKEETPGETFKCPDCGSEVSASTPHCSNCGCPLEWGE